MKYINIFLKSFFILYSSTLFVLGGTRFTNKLDLGYLKPAERLIENGVSATKQYIRIVLPQIKKINQLTHELRKVANSNNYISYTSNITDISGTKNAVSEIVWFPFNLKSYGDKCGNFELSSETVRRHRKLLMLTTNINETISILETCPIQFNDETVLYYEKKDCYTIIFEEVYKINPRERNIYRNIISQVNQSAEKNNLNIPIEYIWKRRSNLQGTMFKVVTELDPPWTNHIQVWKDLTGNELFHHEGFLKDIIDHLKSKLNFTTKTYLPKKRNNWSHLVEQVAKASFDIGGTGFVFNSYRNDIIDFSFGILSVSYTLAYVPDTNMQHFELFLQPYNLNAWIAILTYIMTLIVGCFSLGVIYKGHRKVDRLFKVLLNSTNFALRSIIGRRIDFEPNLNCAKVAFAFIIINGFLLITCYKALLVASMTAKIESPPVTSLKELGSSKYLLGVQKETAAETVFRKATPGSEEYHLIRNKKVRYFSGSQVVILEEMVNNAKMASQMILFTEKPFLLFHDYFPCHIADIKEIERKNQGNMGMIYRKNWPFTDLINYHLLVMKEHGVMDKLLEPYLRATRKLCSNQERIKSIINKPTPVTINATFLLYLIQFFGLLISSFCFVIEVLRHRRVTKTLL